MEKQIGWTCKVSGSESLVISRAGQTVLARLMESHIWHQLPDSVALGDRGRFGKGTMAPAHISVWEKAVP